MLELLPQRHSHMGDINELRDKVNQLVNYVNKFIEEYGTTPNEQRIEEHQGAEERQQEERQGKRRGRPPKTAKANSGHST